MPSVAPTMCGNLHLSKTLVFLLASLMARPSDESVRFPRKPVREPATIREMVDCEAPAISPESSWKLFADSSLGNASNCCDCVRGHDLYAHYSFIRYRVLDKMNAVTAFPTFVCRAQTLPCRVSCAISMSGVGAAGPLP